MSLLVTIPNMLPILPLSVVRIPVKSFQRLNIGHRLVVRPYKHWVHPKPMLVLIDLAKLHPKPMLVLIDLGNLHPKPMLVLIDLADLQGLVLLASIAMENQLSSCPPIRNIGGSSTDQSVVLLSGMGVEDFLLLSPQWYCMT